MDDDTTMMNKYCNTSSGGGGGGGSRGWSWNIVGDVVAAAFCYALCRSLLQLLRPTLSSSSQSHLLQLSNVHVYRKVVHIAGGLIPMLFWPMYSCELDYFRGRLLTSLIPMLCMAVPLVIGRSHKEDELIKSFGRRYHGGLSWDLIKALLSYLFSYAFVTVFYWGSPIAISAICNLCAGDGAADIIGRRWGNKGRGLNSKLPYNKNKSYAGTIGMAIAGFLTSLLFMTYLSWWASSDHHHHHMLHLHDEYYPWKKTVYGFMLSSIASALVESHPLSNSCLLDDNLTVPLASILVASFLF